MCLSPAPPPAGTLQLYRESQNQTKVSEAASPLIDPLT